MTQLTGPSVLLLAAVLCLSSALDGEPVLVVDPKRTLTGSTGSSVKLACNAIYHPELCGWVHVVWIQQGRELTEPNKYLTTVNETVSDDHTRHRQVVTEVLHLTRDDAGEFQCRAECKRGETGIGHRVQVIVQDQVQTKEDK